MSNLVIPHARITRDGTDTPTPVSTDDASGFTIPNNDGNRWLVLTNDTAGASTVEIVPQQTYGGLQLANQICTVAPNSTEEFGPWPPALFNDEDGNVVLVAGEGTLSLHTLGI